MRKLKVKLNTDIWKDPEKMKKTIESTLLILQMMVITNIVLTYIGRNTVTYIFNGMMMIITITSYITMNKNWQRKQEEDKENGRNKNTK